MAYVSKPTPGRGKRPVGGLRPGVKPVVGPGSLRPGVKPVVGPGSLRPGVKPVVGPGSLRPGVKPVTGTLQSGTRPGVTPRSGNKGTTIGGARGATMMKAPVRKRAR